MEVKLPEKEEGKEREDERKEQWRIPEREVAWKDTKLLVVEPARNVSEAEGLQVCLRHESNDEDEDKTVTEAISSISLQSSLLLSHVLFGDEVVLSTSLYKQTRHLKALWVRFRDRESNKTQLSF